VGSLVGGVDVVSTNQILEIDPLAGCAFAHRHSQVARRRLVGWR
jgi:hypothetical protein